MLCREAVAIGWLNRRQFDLQIHVRIWPCETGTRWVEGAGWVVFRSALVRHHTPNSPASQLHLASRLWEPDAKRPGPRHAATTENSQQSRPSKGAGPSRAQKLENLFGKDWSLVRSQKLPISSVLLKVQWCNWSELRIQNLGCPSHACRLPVRITQSPR